MNKTTIVNCRTEQYDVYIGRPSSTYPHPEYGGWQLHFGNPFVLRRDGNRKTVINKFENWIREKDYKVLYPLRRKWILKNLCKLKDKKLGCFCSPKTCHGDVYVKLIKELCEPKNNLLKTNGE